MMVQQNLILILLLWCSGAEAPFKILLRWNTAQYQVSFCDYVGVDAPWHADANTKGGR